jgi:hypothetical protein
LSPLSVVRYAPAEAAVVRGAFPELRSVLETSGQIALLEPCLSNRAKSIDRSPKLHLTDTGLQKLVTGGGVVCRAPNAFPLAGGFRALPASELR